MRRRFQPITLPDLVHPVRSSVGQPVFVGQLTELGQLVQHLAERIVRVPDEQLTQFAEVVLEPSRGDDLDDAAGFAAGVPQACICPRGLVM